MYPHIKSIIGKLLILILLLTSSTPAYAYRILFQDDDYHEIVSEGLIINDDDGGDEDVFLQFGNDTADATIEFDDGTGDLTFATPGDDVFLFDNGSVQAAADAGLDFSAADQFRIREAADPGATATCGAKGELIYDTGSDEFQICTATGSPGTWAAIDQDFESVYSTDADNTLTTAAFDIDASGAVGIDSDAGVTIGGTTIGITADSGILALTGDGTNDIDILNTGAAIDIGSATYTLDTTSTATVTTGETFDVNATGAVGIDSDAGVTIGGTAIGITADSGILALTGDGSADIDISNASAAIDIDSATYTLDTTSTAIITTGSTYDVDSVGAVGIDSDAGVTIGGTAIGITADSGIFALTGDGTNDIDISNASAAIDIDSATFTLDTTGAFTLDSSTISIDSTDTTNLTMTANVAANRALTISATNIDGGGDGLVAISTDVWDITGAGVASGLTGLTVDSGTINMTGSAASNFNTTGAGIDLTFDAAAGRIIIDGGEAAADAIIIQSTGGTTATTHLTSNGTGTAAIDIDTTGSGGDIDIDANDAITIDAGGNIGINVTSGTLSLNNTNNQNIDTGTGTFTVGDGSNGVALSATSGMAFVGTARQSTTVTLIPEYAGATMVADGGSNSGIMTSDFCSEDQAVNAAATPTNASPCDSDNEGEEHNYYTWTSTTASQDYDIWVRWQIPSDFAAFGTDAVRMYGWQTDDSTNTIQVSMFDEDGVADATDVDINGAAALAWTLGTIDGTPGGTYTAGGGGYVTFKIHMVNDATDHVKAGEIIINYLTNR